MKIEAYILGFVIFSLFVVTGGFLIADINKNYAGIITENISTSDFNQTYNTIDNMYNLSQEQKGAVIGGGISSTSISETSFGGALTAFRMVTRTFSLIGNIIQELSAAIGIPSFFIKFAFAALTILITFGIISMILRYKQ